MGYIEAGHGPKGRKVWLFDDDDVKQMYKCNQKKKIYYSGVIPKKRERKQCRNKLAQTKMKC